MSELVINESPLIESGREYYWKRSDGWDWFGTPRWWEVSMRFHNGFNGGGGLFVYELWRWNGSSQSVFENPRNLTYQESREIVDTLIRNMKSEAVPVTEEVTA